MKLAFENFNFEDVGGSVKITFLRLFFFEIPKHELAKLGKYKLGKNFIELEPSAEKKFNFLIAKYMEYPHLKCILNSHTATYVHRNSNIPLIGNLSFGIVDRGSNIIEIKPITGCNLDCTFCSVDEGKSSKKVHEFVVEEEYLAEETKKLIEYKLTEYKNKNENKNKNEKKSEKTGIEIYINPHGEPLLYADIVKLVSDLAKIRQVKNIAIVTNGILLNEKLADELADAGVTQYSISISAIDNDFAKEIMGNKAYDIEKLKKMIRYIRNEYGGIKIVLTPVWVSGLNDEEMPKLIAFAEETGCDIKIQNFLCHGKGRKPRNTKEIPFEDFYKKLDALEKKYDIKLSYKDELKLEKTKELEMPFRKGGAVKADIICHGRYKNQCIGAVQNRNILIERCNFNEKSKKYKKDAIVRILKAKNNIFIGSPYERNLHEKNINRLPNL